MQHFKFVVSFFDVTNRLNVILTFGMASSIISRMAASLYSFQASAFLAIFSASALALVSIAKASASPRSISASASA